MVVENQTQPPELKRYHLEDVDVKTSLQIMSLSVRLRKFPNWYPPIKQGPVRQEKLFEDYTFNLLRQENFFKKTAFNRPKKTIQQGF